MIVTITTECHTGFRTDLLPYAIRAAQMEENEKAYDKRKRQKAHDTSPAAVYERHLQDHGVRRVYCDNTASQVRTHTPLTTLSFLPGNPLMQRPVERVRGRDRDRHGERERERERQRDRGRGNKREREVRGEKDLHMRIAARMHNLF
jgi:hypothetical protein